MCFGIINSSAIASALGTGALFIGKGTLLLVVGTRAFTEGYKTAETDKKCQAAAWAILSAASFTLLGALITSVTFSPIGKIVGGGVGVAALAAIAIRLLVTINQKGPKIINQSPVVRYL